MTVRSIPTGGTEGKYVVTRLYSCRCFFAKLVCMFKDLADFSKKRSGKQALGFYMVYFLISLFIGALGGAISSLISGAATPSENFSLGLRVGAVVAILYSLVISSLVVTYRKLYKNILYLVLILVSGVFAVFGGSLLGLIIPALLTSVRERDTEKN